MFGNLEDQIRQTSAQPVSRMNDALRVLGLVVVTAVLFDGLCLGILLFE
jgi:hypothetical protein